jgi:hypothetical protein
MPTTLLGVYFEDHKNVSQRIRKMDMEQARNDHEIAPAFQTRMRDHIATVNENDFAAAYHMVQHPLLSSKTKENSFQTLNRTLWTNNKAFKSRKAESAKCDYCDSVETMEHLLMTCENYSELRWQQLSDALKIATRTYTNVEHASADITFASIIFNKEIEGVKIHIKEKHTRQSIQMLIHETRRDIYYRKQAFPPRERNPVNHNRILAHNTATTNKCISFLKYLSGTQWREASAFLDHLKNTLSNMLQETPPPLNKPSCLQIKMEN